jgi:hypothetical protein
MKDTKFKYRIMVYCNTCNRVEETERYLDISRRVAKIGCVHCVISRDIPLLDHTNLNIAPISEFCTWWIPNWKLQAVNISITKIG